MKKLNRRNNWLLSVEAFATCNCSNCSCGGCYCGGDRCYGDSTAYSHVVSQKSDSTGTTGSTTSSGSYNQQKWL